MSLFHFTERHYVRLVSTQSRRTDVTPWQLSRAHMDLGRYLASEMVELLPMETCEILHPQGIRTGWKIAQETQIVLLVFMRAGLYLAEGIREVLQNAPVLTVNPTRGRGLVSDELDQLASLNGKVIVLIDAVVNTGASMEPVLEQVKKLGVSKCFVVSLVAPVSTAARLEKEHPGVDFLLARISENQYTGQGNTDTGNRLFGTLTGKSL